MNWTSQPDASVELGARGNVLKKLIGGGICRLKCWSWHCACNWVIDNTIGYSRCDTEVRSWDHGWQWRQRTDRPRVLSYSRLTVMTGKEKHTAQYWIALLSPNHYLSVREIPVLKESPHLCGPQQPIRKWNDGINYKVTSSSRYVRICLMCLPGEAEVLPVPGPPLNG